MQTDVYIKIINEKMNMEFWMAGFLVIPKVYAVIASPFMYINIFCEKLKYKIKPNFSKDITRPPLVIFFVLLKKFTITSHFPSPNGQGLNSCSAN